VKITIVGASGFIGKHLSSALRARGDIVSTASLRDPDFAARACDGADAVVNLAGEGVAQRWTKDVKERIRASRVDAPRALIERLSTLAAPPKAYVSASATGYYGASEDATFTEESPAGDDFLARVCADWEATAHGASAFGARVAIVRTGIALGTDGGALAKMLPIFKLGGGGPLGSGRQWLSWVHVADVTGVYLTAIDGAAGVLNATAPEPVTNAQFTHALGHAVHRPAFVPVPEIALALLFGEGAKALVTGQRVLPARTQSLGYRFRFPDLASALHDLIGKCN